MVRSYAEIHFYAVIQYLYKKYMMDIEFDKAITTGLHLYCSHAIYKATRIKEEMF